MDFTKLFDLSGKNAMIVGGAGGLGKLVAPNAIKPSLSFGMTFDKLSTVPTLLKISIFSLEKATPAESYPR